VGSTNHTSARFDASFFKRTLDAGSDASTRFVFPLGIRATHARGAMHDRTAMSDAINDRVGAIVFAEKFSR
jgi:hypothetical protein